MLATELLVQSEQRRQDVIRQLDPVVQSTLGQFFTPHAAADFIASLPALPKSGTLKILDPGAGTGSLAASLVARIIRESPKLEVHVVAVELDAQVSESLRHTLNDIETSAVAAGVSVTTEIVQDDFIDPMREFANDFDIVIMNPPYAKLPAASRHRAIMSQRGVQAPNIYAAFLGKGAQLLKDGGQLVAITPRSFMNGVYFEPFRTFLLNMMALDRIHVFDSRSTVFADTGVLQENVIINAVKAKPGETVKLSISVGHKDEVRIKDVPYASIVRPGDKRRFISIPVGEEDDAIVTKMLDLPTTPADLGVTISTGRVVDFRSRENLLPESTTGYPMVYPANVRGGFVEHPRPNSKPQWFNAVKPGDLNWLVPAGTYLLVKRFSSKEERRRIVAGIWTEEDSQGKAVAFDNKLNYIHHSGAGLDHELAAGLSLWLNSSPVDRYFRTFSGHTQVNATDLREMRYPTAEQLRKLGYGQPSELPEQEVIDHLVMTILGWSV